jgi:ATP-dependent Zn protease
MIAYAHAQEIILAYRDTLDVIANHLMLAESIDGDELRKLIARAKLAPTAGLVSAPVASS